MKLFNEKCPHCGNYNITVDSQVAKLEQSPVSFLTLFLPISCSNCGWKGEESYRCVYLRTSTTNVPYKTFKKQLVPVDSSVIAKIGYDPEEELLAIQFHTGTHVYLYSCSDTSLFINFLNAPSKGRFYGEEIRGQFTRVDSGK